MTRPDPKKRAQWKKQAARGDAQAARSLAELRAWDKERQRKSRELRKQAEDQQASQQQAEDHESETSSTGPPQHNRQSSDPKRSPYSRSSTSSHVSDATSSDFDAPKIDESSASAKALTSAKERHIGTAQSYKSHDSPKASDSASGRGVGSSKSEKAHVSAQGSASTGGRGRRSPWRPGSSKEGKLNNKPAAVIQRFHPRDVNSEPRENIGNPGVDVEKSSSALLQSILFPAGSHDSPVNKGKVRAEHASEPRLATPLRPVSIFRYYDEQEKAEDLRLSQERRDYREL